MGAVHVGVRHDDDLVVAQLVEVGVFLADASAHGRDEGLHFLVGQHLVEAGALGVQDLAAQGQDGLVARVAALLGGAACGVTFHDEQFGFRGVLALAVGQLAGQGVVRERALAAHQFLGAAGGVAGAGGVHGLVDDQADVLGVLLKVDREPVIDHAGHHTGHFAVAELGLGLAFELGLGQLDADDGRKALAHVVARQGRALELLGQVRLVLHITVDGAGERRAEAHQMRAAFLGMDVVGEGEDGLLVAGVVLEGKVDGHIVHHAFGHDDGMDALLAGVEVAHELADAALGVEHMGLAGALVDALDVQALVEVGQLLEALLEGVV